MVPKTTPMAGASAALGFFLTQPAPCTLKQGFYLICACLAAPAALRCQPAAAAAALCHAGLGFSRLLPRLPPLPLHPAVPSPTTRCIPRTLHLHAARLRARKNHLRPELHAPFAAPKPKMPCNTRWLIERCMAGNG
jgi:hypothetical protein